jgi:hypothetical protein
VGPRSASPISSKRHDACQVRLATVASATARDDTTCRLRCGCIGGEEAMCVLVWGGGNFHLMDELALIACVDHTRALRTNQPKP